MISQIVLVDTHGYESWKSRLHRRLTYLTMFKSRRLDGPSFIQIHAKAQGIPQRSVARLISEGNSPAVLWFQDSGFLSVDALTWKSLVENRRILVGPNFDLGNAKLLEYLSFAQDFKLLFPSSWVEEIAINGYGIPRNRCEVWTTGVAIEQKTHPRKPRKKVLVYNKFQDDLLAANLAIVKDFCHAYCFSMEIINYGQYNHKKFIRQLNESLFVIWFGITESQSIAQFEIWASDVSTLVLAQDYIQFGGQTYPSSSSPYLSEQTGEFFYNDKFSIDLLEKFYSKIPIFTPKKWISINGEIKESFATLQNFYEL